MMRKLWRWAIAGVGTAALAAGLVVTAAPAGAAAKPTSQAAAIQTTAIQTTQAPRQATAAACTTARNYESGYATFTYCGGDFNREPCTGTWVEIFGPKYAANGCSTRLYLWTSSGDNLCVNPLSSTGVLKKDYTSAEITRIGSKCGT